MKNNFELALEAVLNRIKSIANIRKDIKSIEQSLPKVKLQGTLDAQKTKKELSKLNTTPVKIKIDADTKLAEGKIKKLTQGKSHVEITPGVDNTKLSSDLKVTEKETKSFFGKLSNNVAGLNIFNIAFQKISQSIREAFANVKESDRIKTDIQMAAGVSNTEVDNMMKSYNQLGKELSSTTKKVAESANEFIRMGESVSNTSELIKNAQILSQIGMIDSADAASYLISGMKGYQIAAQDSIKIVDKLTSVDMEAAVSAGGLAEALSRTSNIANASGTSMDRLIGYIATVGETTQKSMSEVGNSFQSIYSRMNNIKIGRFIDDETGESLSDTESVLNKLGIKLRDTSNTYRDFDDVLDDVGKNWNHFTQVEQNAISVAVAGTRQRENFMSLMTRYGDALKYSEVAANSAGTSMERYAQFQDSIEAKTNELTNSFEALSTNIISEDLYKGILEATTGIIEFTDKTNLLKGTLAGLATYGASKTFVSMATGIISAAKSTAQLTTAMAMFNNGRSTENLKDIGEACKGLTDKQLKLVLSTKGLTNSQRLWILNGKGVEESQQQQTLTTLGFSAAEDKATVSTFSFAGALNSLKAAFASNPVGIAFMAITTAVSIGTMAYSSYKQSLEETRQATSEAAKAFDETASSINDYAEKYKKLHDELNKTNTTEERQHEIKSELLSLQQELNEKYGDEYGKLNLVTDAYKDQTEAILAMNKAAAQNYLLENRKGIADATKEMEKTRTYSLGSTGDLREDYAKQIYDIASKYENQGIKLNSFENGDIKGYTIKFSGDAEDANRVIHSLANEIQELSKEFKDNHFVNSFLDNSANALERNKEVLDKYDEIYNSALMSNIATDDELSEGYNKATNAVKAYNDALASGDESKILSARDNLNVVKGSIDLTSDNWKRYGNIMTDIFDQADTGLYDFRDALASNKDNLQSFAKIIKDKAYSKEDLLSMANDDNPDYFDRLVEGGKKYGLTVEQVINELARMGAVQDYVATTGEQVEKSFKDSFSSLPTEKIEEYITLLNSGKLNEGSISSYSELNQLMRDTGASAENAVKSIKEYSEGFTLSTDLISNMQGAYDLLKNVGEQYKKTGLIGLSSLESITKQYPQLRNAVNEYVNGLISAEDMMAQLQTAYDNDVIAFKTDMLYKLSDNETFFSHLVSNNQAFFNELSNAYGMDIKNWTTLAQAKAGIDQKLIQDLSKAWSKYYSVSVDPATNMASIGGWSNPALGTDQQLEKSNALLAAAKAVNDRNKAASKFDELANIEIEVPDFGGIGSVDKSGSKKAKEETKKDIDWIARATKVVQDEYAKLEELANKDTIAYLGLTQDEFDKAKSIFDNGLGNSIDGLSQLQGYADKAGLSLGELYTMIQSGAPSESKENALQSMLQMQTETLLPQYQREVEAYSKAYEDALKAIPSEYKGKIENGGVDIESLPSDLAEKVQAAIDANEKLKSSEKQLGDGEKEHIATIKELHENRIDAIDIENEKLQQSNKIIKSQMELMEARGKIVDADFYKRQISNNKGLISGTQQNIAEWESEMADLRAAKFDTNSKDYKELQAKVRAAKSEIYGMKLEQEELNQTLKQMPIDHLSTMISMYGDITAKIENWGAVYSATGAKLNAEYYQTLISNGTTVIGQYEKQIKEIKNLMSEAQKGSTVWQELYNQLQDIDSATSSMVTNLQKWNEELLKMPLDSINTYSDSLQKVITGLNGVKSELDSATSAITAAISDQIDLLEEEKKAAVEAQQAEIDAMQEKADAIRKVNEALQKQLAVERDKYNLDRARNQKTNVEIRDGEKVYTNDYDAVRQAEEALANSKADLEEYNLQQQIEDAKTALDDLNDGYQKQIEALEEISKKYSEISTAAEKISNANLANSLLGEGWADKVLSGNDEEIYATLTSLYQTNAEQLEQYQKQAESTENIYSLLEDYIASYKAGEITYEQATTKINDLLSQLNNSMSAMDNLQNIFDYLGTVNGVGADADSILNGIKDGLAVTADELVKSLEQYNKNSGMISEYTSSWQQLTDNVKSMLDVLKQVRDNLRNALDDYDSDDDGDSDKTSSKGWGSDDAGNGPGVYGDGIKKGAIGTSNNDRVKMLKHLSTHELKDGEVPIIAHEGEVVLNPNQQEQLLDNVDTSENLTVMQKLEKHGLRKIEPDELPVLLDRGEEVFNNEKLNNLLKNLASANSFKPNIPDYSSFLNQITVRESTPKQEINFNGGINIQECNNTDTLAKEILNGGLTRAVIQGLGKR